jgi:hypothetical protein
LKRSWFKIKKKCLISNGMRHVVTRKVHFSYKNHHSTSLFLTLKLAETFKW